MNQKNNLFLIILNKLLCFPLFCSYIILLVRTASCSADPKFEACQPKTCGNNQTIIYPFYIQGVQPPFCGYPGFGVSCAQNGFPILNLSNTQYIINEIRYQNHSLKVSNSVFLRSNISPGSSCLPPTLNLTFSSSTFNLFPKQKDVVLLYGCDLPSLPTGLKEKTIGCSLENETSSVLALYKEDKNLSFVSKNCRGEVVDATVEDGIGGNIEEALRNGFWLNWTASDCSLCNSTGGKCGFDSQIYSFRCYCTDRVHAQKCDPPVTHKKKNLSTKAKLSIGLGIAILGILLLGMLFLLLLYRRKHATFGGHLESRNSYSDSTFNLRRESSSVYFGVPLFSYKELKEATNNFDHTKELGDGGFGTVYYGKLPDGREVAVKRLYEHNYRRVEQFMNEVEILTRLRHKNLVSLYGCTSRHSRELLLVYEYIPNGTVACHLYGGLAKPGLLPWSTRIKIAIETASALTYLHASDIVHRDVKSSNILLDSNFCVKVGDFGLSRPFPTDVTHVSTAPQGTPGYVDPEYHQCYQLTSKSDVYSFGVVLIELLSSKPAVDINRSKDEINLSNLAIKKIQESAIDELVDPYLGFDSDNEVNRMIVSVAELAFQCLQRDKELRPSMEKVLEELRRIESGKDEVGVSHSHSHGNGDLDSSPPAASPEWDAVGVLKNMKLPPSSPNTVTDKWESKCTTPNFSA